MKTQALWLLALVLFLATGCVSTGTAPAQSTASRDLHHLVDDYFEETLEIFPTSATFIGDHRFDDQLGNPNSPASLARQRRLYLSCLRALDRLPSDELSEADQLTFDIFKSELETRAAGLDFPGHLIPVNQMFSLPLMLPVLGSGTGPQPFKTVQDYRKFISRAREFEPWVNTAILNMREGLRQGVTQPRPVMERTLQSLRNLAAQPVEESIFYGPIRRFPDSISPADQFELSALYRELIERDILPAYQKLIQFLEHDYLPRCRDTVALSALPGGPEWYAYLVRSQTSTTLSPDEIFEIGEREFARLIQRMEQVKKREGFSGTVREFVVHLENRPGAGHTTKPDLVKAYDDLREKVESELPKLFRRIPKAPYEIRPVEEFRENSAPSQYWPPAPDGSRPGIFYVNAASIKTRPMHVSESLYLHEAMPGHHFQIALSYEQRDLPRFRRFGRHIAFTEGWGLYSELLGYELGCFTDPYQELTYLGADLWRVQRLVVDVGLHHKGWSRQQAIDFMNLNPIRVEQAEREVDRYIAIPGQALSYKIGQLKISELRARALNALGQRFDIRAFHDELLREGPMPLDLLEARMDKWIAGQKPKP